MDAHIPNYPSLPPQLICQLHNLTMHADVETDEVYAQVTLQPLSPQEQKDATFLPADLGTSSKQPTNYFCKTLMASDTSTHGGFSVPRLAAESVPSIGLLPAASGSRINSKGFLAVLGSIFIAGQPKRHLLTTGWSVFVSATRLVAGDSVLFIWNEKNQLLLGIRRANRPQTVMPSSVLSSDSMHLGLLAAAAHAAATNSRFTIFYNPRASPSEFVIPLTKYVKAVYHTRVSVGMRFRMLFETEESSVRRTKSRKEEGLSARKKKQGRKKGSQHQLKLRISRMLRSSFGSCTSRNISDDVFLMISFCLVSEPKKGEKPVKGKDKTTKPI